MARSVTQSSIDDRHITTIAVKKQNSKYKLDI